MFIFYKLFVPIIVFLFIAILNINPIVVGISLLIVLVLSVFLVNLVITPRTFSFLTTKDFLKSQHDIYFIGSSRIHTVFNPKIIEEYTNGLSVYTFGNDLQNFTLSSYLARELIKQHRPKMIIIDSHYIRSNYMENTMMPIKYYRAILTALNSQQRKEFAQLYKKDKGSVLKDLLLFKEFSTLNLQVLMSNNEYTNMYKGFRPITEPRDEPTVDYDFVPEDAKFKNIKTPKRKPIHNQYKREVLYLLKFANANKIKLFFIDTPIYSEDLSREVSSCEYSNYLTYFAKKTKQKTKVINLNKHIEDLEMIADDFDDSLHLMESGSTVISHYMGNFIQDCLFNSGKNKILDDDEDYDEESTLEEYREEEKQEEKQETPPEETS